MNAIISRLVAPFIAAIVAWLVGLGLDLGADFQTALTDVATLFVGAVMLALYGLIHKKIDSRINPSDDAR